MPLHGHNIPKTSQVSVTDVDDNQTAPEIYADGVSTFAANEHILRLTLFADHMNQDQQGKGLWRQFKSKVERMHVMDGCWAGWRHAT